MSVQYLTKRGNQFQFYRRVPTELVDRIGRTFWRESLRADSPSIARQRIIAHIHRTNLLIEEARTGALSENTVREFAHAWRWTMPDLNGEGGALGGEGAGRLCALVDRPHSDPDSVL